MTAAPSLDREPEVRIARREGAPFLVEHWYLAARVRRHMIVRRFREVLRHAALEPGQRVLDLGCGWAFGQLWMRALGCRSVGIDLGMDQLTWAKRGLERGPELDLVCTNARELPFPDRSFDRAVSVEMMEHVFRPDRPRVLAEIARVVTPGGRISISTPNAVSPIEVVKRLAVKMPALRRRLPSSCFPEAEDDAGTYHPYRYHHPLPVAELRAGLAGVGFEVLGSKTFLWIPKTLPDALLGPGKALESLLEAVPGSHAFGATTLVWARRR